MRWWHVIPGGVISALLPVAAGAHELDGSGNWGDELTVAGVAVVLIGLALASRWRGTGKPDEKDKQ